MTATKKSSTTAVKPARKGTVRTSSGKGKAPVTFRSIAVEKPAAKAPRPAGTKSAAAKAAAKVGKAKARPIGTPTAPLPSGWVRQSLAPRDGAASKFTTQTQRRLLRAIVSGDVTSAGDLPLATQRTVGRLADLGFITVAKNGAIRATKAGTEFVAENPAPRIRTAKVEAPAKPARKAATPRKAPAKAAKAPAKGTGRKVVRKVAK